MRLGTINQETLLNGRTRLHAEVVYDSFYNFTDKDNFYFEYPSDVINQLTDNGNAWLALFLPISVILNENLIITKPVDPQLLEGCLELLKIWNHWDPSLPIISIEADIEINSNKNLGKTGTFFSGGVDSLHTLLRHEDISTALCLESIDELISIIDIYEYDTDTSSANSISQEKMRTRIRNVSQEYNKNIIDINTNIWSTRFSLTNSLTHSLSSFLAAIALSLGNRYSRVLVPSSWTYKQGLVGSSHPLVDRLYSTPHTKLIPDACEYNRFEKINYLSNCNYDMSNIHVCSRDVELENCSECYKCIHSMLGLEVLEVLTKCTLFKNVHLVLDKASRIYCSTSYLLFELQSIQEKAISNRPDIAILIDTVFQRSAWIDACRRLINKIDDGGLLNSNDFNLLEELIGVKKSGVHSEATRNSLDGFLKENQKLHLDLVKLGTQTEVPRSDISICEAHLYFLKCALLSGSYLEPTLEQQVCKRDAMLVAPDVIYIDGKPYACI